MQASLDKETEIIAFLHFPPIWNGAVCEPIMQVLKDYGIRKCYFGHIHGISEMSFEADGITFILTAADALGFVPKAVF